MKRNLIIAGIALLVLPVLIRTAWFYQGIYQRTEAVKTPDFASYTVPQAPQSAATPQPAAANASDNSVADAAEWSGPAPVVLFDMTHSNLFNLAEIEPFTSELETLGAQIAITNTFEAFEKQLRSANSLVVIAPMMAYTAGDIIAIRNFIAHGGRLFVIADPTRSAPGYYSDYTTVMVAPIDIANLLLSTEHLAFANDYVYNLAANEGNFRNVIYKNLPKGALSEGVNEIVFYSSHSLSSAPKPLVVGDESTVSSLTDSGSGLAVAATNDNGSVLALGDLSFMTAPFDQVADNARLIQNLAAYALNESRTHELADFPFIFDRPVQFLLLEDSPLDSSTINVLKQSEASLNAWGGKLELAEEPQDGKDLIAVGTYRQAQDELKDLLAPFKLEFKEESSESDYDFDFDYSFDATPTPDAPEPGDPALTPDAFLTATPTPYDPGVGGGFEDFGSSDDSEAEWTGTITVPNFGAVKSSGIGLVFFNPGEERNELILLAGTSATISDLSARLSSEGLSFCAIQGKVAVCPLSSGFGF